VDNDLRDEQLEMNIDALIRLKNLALNLRTQSKVKIRQPLGTLYIRPKDQFDKNVLDSPQYLDQIKEEVNVKHIALIFDETEQWKVHLKPNAKKLGPRAGKDLKAIQRALEKAEVNAARILQGVPASVEIEDGKPYTLELDEIDFSYDVPEQIRYLLDPATRTFMALDTTLTPVLLQEGVARDFNRLVQDQRKTLGLDISDRIVVSYAASPRIAEAIATHQDYLRSELLAERLEPSSEQNGAAKLSLAGEDIFVTISRA